MKFDFRHRIASWMLVPAILIVPAFISGISIWNSWGPHWLLVSIAVTAALLALLIDYQRAVRWALVGVLLGFVTSPILLFLPRWDWALFAWWIIAVALLTAFLVPLVWSGSSPPPEQLSLSRSPQSEAEKALDRLLSNVSQPPKA
ncbi:MAG: hypothetical protein U0X20_02555 [Caldilineaceae bacterium]